MGCNIVQAPIRTWPDKDAKRLSPIMKVAAAIMRNTTGPLSSHNFIKMGGEAVSYLLISEE